MRQVFPLLAAFLALPAGCNSSPDEGPVTVSVVGSTPAIAEPGRKPMAASDAALLSAVAQGLVRFDGAGQIEPGLAIRWDVSDDGLYYTFRLADGLGLDAEDAARRLKAAIGSRSRNPMKPLFAAVDEIVAVTPEVIEIRLKSPRPYLLELLAQPEMALVDEGTGTGPFQIAIRERQALTLSPILAPDEEISAAERARREIKLRGERAALAVARFGDGDAALVLGGTFADLAIARAAAPPARTLRFDPVNGLFGLAVVESKGFLASPENRRVLAMSIDRARIAAAFPASGWRTSESLIAPGTTDGASAVRPDWADLPLALRRQIAAGTVGLWIEREGVRPKLRIAMPEGPGSRLLYTLLSIGWRQIGVETELVEADADADLRLIDAVAPSDSAAWYLHRFSCRLNAVCSARADEALEAAALASTNEERSVRLTEAAAALAEAVPFLPIAQPVRWSLVSPRLRGFQENARGAHPFLHLLDQED